MSGPHPGDPFRAAHADSAFTGLRVAASLDLGGAFPVDTDVRDAFGSALSDIEDLIGPVSRTHPDMTGGVQAFKTLRAAESWFRAGKLVETYEDQLSPSFVWNVQQGRTISAADYLQAETVRTSIWRRASAFFSKYDILIMPTCAVMPFDNDSHEILEVGGQTLPSIIDYLACTFLVSLIGFPALSLPAPRAPGKLPFGVQLVSAPGNEAALMRLASTLEANGFQQLWTG